MQAVTNINLPHGRFQTQAVEISAALEIHVVKSNVLIVELRYRCIQVKQILSAVNPAGYAGIVKTLQVLIEQIKVFIYFFGSNHKAEVLVADYILAGFDITRVIPVEEGLERGRQFLDGKCSHNRSVK